MKLTIYAKGWEDNMERVLEADASDCRIYAWGIGVIEPTGEGDNGVKSEERERIFPWGSIDFYERRGGAAGAIVVPAMGIEGLRG